MCMPYENRCMRYKDRFVRSGEVAKRNLQPQITEKKKNIAKISVVGTQVGTELNYRCIFSNIP